MEEEDDEDEEDEEDQETGNYSSLINYCVPFSNGSLIPQS